MRIFKEPNLSSGWKCPICNTDEKKEIVLIPIDGTQDGNIYEAEQFHLDCITLIYNKQMNILYQTLGKGDK